MKIVTQTFHDQNKIILRMDQNQHFVSLKESKEQKEICKKLINIILEI